MTSGFPEARTERFSRALTRAKSQGETIASGRMVEQGEGWALPGLSGTTPLPR